MPKFISRVHEIYSIVIRIPMIKLICTCLEKQRLVKTKFVCKVG